MADLFVRSQHNKRHMSHVVKGGPDDVKILSTFCTNPIGVSFQNQKSDEDIILFLRAHFITNIGWIFLASIFVLIPIIILLILPSFGISLIPFQNSISLTIILTIFYYMIVFSYVFINFLHWFYNSFIVTNQRVVDIDYSDIVLHNISLTKLTHLQDVTYSQSGFIPSFFNYGNIFVQTAGTEVNFEAYSVPKPRDAVHIIEEMMGKSHPLHK
jgi:hypothetical protein